MCPPGCAVQEMLDGKVLRFFCCWDDTRSMFGQKLPFVLYYYLKWVMPR